MKKQLMALAAALLAGLVTFAADPGGHFGFVKATFTWSLPIFLERKCAAPA